MEAGGAVLAAGRDGQFRGRRAERMKRLSSRLEVGGGRERRDGGQRLNQRRPGAVGQGRGQRLDGAGEGGRALVEVRDVVGGQRRGQRVGGGEEVGQGRLGF